MKLKLKSILKFYEFNVKNDHPNSQNMNSFNLFDNKIFIDKMRYKKIVINTNYNLYKAYMLKTNRLCNRLKYEQ